MSEQLFGFSDVSGIDINYRQAGDEFSIVMSGNVSSLDKYLRVHDTGQLNGSPVLVSLYVKSDPDFAPVEDVEKGESDGSSNDSN